MCTLSLVVDGASDDGASRDQDYLLAMNRDERIARGPGKLPEVHQIDSVRALYPSDGAGGTWIAANEIGITLALLNWNQPLPPSLTQPQSRGTLIPALISMQSLEQIQAGVDGLDLHSVKPFRLVGVFAAERAIREWRWDARALERFEHEWTTQHWFSSSLGDDEAGCFRSAVCHEALKQPGAGSAARLRGLHASHGAQPAYGICVHREEVRTLSFTEILCTPERTVMTHSMGNPCTPGDRHTEELRRASPARQS